MEQNRDFKGVWFPREVWLDTRLSALDKIILLEIDSLDNEETGCFASNEYLADFCQCSVRKITDSISLLTKLEYIYVESFNGRNRVLRSNLKTTCAKQTSKNCEADFQNLLVENNNKDIIKDNNINNLKNNTNILKEKNKKENYNVDNLAEIYSYWNSKNIIVHNHLTEEMVKGFKKVVEEYKLSIEEIKIAIDRYKQILDDKDYYFNYKWTLAQFLSRKEAIREFLDDGGKWNSYLTFKNNPKGLKNKPNQQPEPQRYKGFDIDKDKFIDTHPEFDLDDLPY